jgi:hypothetical protein
MMIDGIWVAIQKEVRRLSELIKDQKMPEGAFTRSLGRWQVQMGNYLSVLIYGTLVLAVIWQLVGWPAPLAESGIVKDGAIVEMPAEPDQRPLGKYLVEGRGPHIIAIVLLIGLAGLFTIRILVRIAQLLKALHLFAFYGIFKLLMWWTQFTPGLYEAKDFNELGQRFAEGVWKSVGG